MAIEYNLKYLRQKRFCMYIMMGFPQYKAYIMAGYSADGAHENASRLIRNDKVKKILGRMQNNYFEDIEVLVSEMVQKLVSIAMSDITQIANCDGKSLKPISFDQLPANAAGTIKKLTAGQHGWTIEQYSPTKAIQALFKLLNLSRPDNDAEIEELKKAAAANTVIEIHTGFGKDVGDDEYDPSKGYGGEDASQPPK